MTKKKPFSFSLSDQAKAALAKDAAKKDLSTSQLLEKHLRRIYKIPNANA